MSEILQQDNKNRKKAIFIIAAILVTSVMLLAYYINSKQKRALPPPPPAKIDLSGKQDTAKDAFIKQSTAQIKEQGDKMKDLQKEIEEMKQLKKGVSSPSTKENSGFPTIPPPMPPATVGAEAGQSIPYAPASQLAPSSPGAMTRGRALSNLIALETKTVKTDKTDKTDPKTGDSSMRKAQNEDKEHRASGKISAGSFVKAVLLNGLDAPSGTKGKGSPYPVIARITDLAQLPNRFRADIRECFAIGEAYGELSSERTMVRVNYLSCNAKNGASVESAVNGYVVGEDGKLGLAGTVVTKQGALLERSMIAGFLQGVSQAFAQSSSIVNIQPTGNTTTIDPTKVAQAGIGGGFAKATDELSRFFIENAKEMFPVVEVSAGRKIEIVFIKPVTLKEEGR